jgi:hypothetical protein
MITPPDRRAQSDSSFAAVRRLVTGLLNRCSVEQDEHLGADRVNAASTRYAASRCFRPRGVLAPASPSEFETAGDAPDNEVSWAVASSAGENERRPEAAAQPNIVPTASAITVRSPNRFMRLSSGRVSGRTANSTIAGESSTPSRLMSFEIQIRQHFGLKPVSLASNRSASTDSQCQTSLGKGARRQPFGVVRGGWGRRDVAIFDKWRSSQQSARDAVGRRGSTQKQDQRLASIPKRGRRLIRGAPVKAIRRWQEWRTAVKCVRRAAFSVHQYPAVPPTCILSNMGNQFADDCFDVSTTSIGGGLLADSASH